MGRGQVDKQALIFAPTPRGGLAEHVHYQARELVRRGYGVTLLCTPAFCKAPQPDSYRQVRGLLAVAGNGLGPRVGRVIASVANWYILAWRIVCLRPAFVLLEANTEYYAALWAWPHILLRWVGVPYVANFHDPVRARRFGPKWWHRLTLRLAYAPLKAGLIHGPVPHEAGIPKRVVMREAPFGAFEALRSAAAPGDLRSLLGIPEQAFVLLAFGHVADRKRLDLVIEALAVLPDTYLLVAGSTGSAADRPIEFYIRRADELGLGHRAQFQPGFIPESAVAGYFAAADAVALTYERGFVSQSGVLHIAALWDKPVLASGGEGPLRRAVDEFHLGVTIEADSAAAIVAGLRKLMTEQSDYSAAFARYRATMSWSANVDRLLEVALA